MAKKQSKRFPEFLHVTIENEGEESQYFDVTDDPEGHAELGENVRVGVYKLVEVATLTTEVKSRSRL